MIAAAFAALERAYRQTPARFVGALAVAAFLIRAAFAPYGTPLYLDAYAYMLKALEIARGDYTPIHTHAIGWSIVLAPAMWLWQNRPVMEQMNAVRVVTCAVSALGAIPLYAIATATIAPRAGVIALLMYPFVLKVTSVAFHGLSEPLHALAALAAIAFAVRAGDRRRCAVFAGVCAGAACWIHPTGVLVPIVVVVVVVWQERERRSRLLAASTILIVAAIAAAPVMIQRASVFGHPFDFGGNNRLFGDSDQEMWSDTLPVPTAASYWRTHDAAAIAKRIAVDGVAIELRDFGEGALTYPVVPFALWGTWIAWRNRRTRPLVIASALFLAAWVVPYPVLGASRHLVPILPLAFVFVAMAVDRIAAWPPRGLATAAALVCALAIGHSIAAGVQRSRQQHGPAMAGLEWGRWIAANVRGRVAVREGQELIMMHLPDAAIGGADINTMYARRSGVTLVKPGYFPGVDEALAWMRTDRVTHLVVDDFLDPPPYLAPLRAHPRQPFLRELFSTVGRSPWPVRVFAIAWPLYTGRIDVSQ